MYDFHNLVYSDFSLRSTTRPRFALDDIVGALIPSRDEKREVVKTASRFLFGFVMKFCLLIR